MKCNRIFYSTYGVLFLYCFHYISIRTNNRDDLRSELLKGHEREVSEEKFSFVGREEKKRDGGYFSWGFQ